MKIVSYVKSAALALVFAFCIAPVYAAALTPEEQAIIDAIERSAEDQINFLESAVNINSGTLNAEGVREVGDLFGRALQDIGFVTDWVELPPELRRAGHLVAIHPGVKGSGKRVLLLGHLDTVFPVDSPFQRFERDGDTAKGPGVSDMKSGDVIILFALKALQAAGQLDGAQITVMFTGDEEKVGLPHSKSRAPMVALAKENDVALSFEGGNPENAVVARRGTSGWKLKVMGRRAHSSGIFGEDTGVGAIFEAARILNAFYENVRGPEYLTFNPGFIAGGTQVEVNYETSRSQAFGKTNVVAQIVEVAGGLRFITEQQKEEARAKMREIVALNLPGTSAEISFNDGYPAMAPTAGNLALFKELTAINKALGYPPPVADDPGSRGAGDISFVAPYISGLDGLGGTGDREHSPGENLDLTSLMPMTKRAALLIYRLTQVDGTADE